MNKGFLAGFSLLVALLATSSQAQLSPMLDELLHSLAGRLASQSLGLTEKEILALSVREQDGLRSAIDKARKRFAELHGESKANRYFSPSELAIREEASAIDELGALLRTELAESQLLDADANAGSLAMRARKVAMPMPEGRVSAAAPTDEPVIVILSAPYGKGHDAAQDRVAEAILKKNPKARIVKKNMQDFMSRFVKETTYNGFTDAQTNHPRRYDWGFNRYMNMGQAVEHVGQMPMGRLMDMNGFVRWLNEQGPHAVIATWHHATELIARARRAGHLLEVPVGWVHTDNVVEAYYQKAAMEVEQAFMPGPRTRQGFVDNGVPPRRLTTSGMPLNLGEREPLTLESIQARKIEARKKLGIDPDRRTFLIEGGGNGVGNYPLMVGSVAAAFPGEKITIVAACANNKEQKALTEMLIAGVGDDEAKAKNLFKALKPLLKEGVPEETLRAWIRDGLPKDLIDARALGWEPVIPWRLAANVTAGKPGGLSTAETAAEGIETILRTGVASGQEKHNVKDSVAAGLAVANENDALIGAKMREVLENERFLAELPAASNEFRKNIRTDLIADWALRVAQDPAGSVTWTPYSAYWRARTCIGNALLTMCF